MDSFTFIIHSEYSVYRETKHDLSSISPAADRLKVVPPMLAKNTPLDAAFIGDSVITVGSGVAGATSATVAGAAPVGWVAAVTATEGASTATDE